MNSIDFIRDLRQCDDRRPAAVSCLITGVVDSAPPRRRSPHCVASVAAQCAGTRRGHTRLGQTAVIGPSVSPVSGQPGQRRGGSNGPLLPGGGVLQRGVTRSDVFEKRVHFVFILEFKKMNICIRFEVDVFKINLSGCDIKHVKNCSFPRYFGTLP